VNQILEDMLRACALDYGSSWDDNLPYAEFFYNNSHQASIEMAPFEALYRRKCTTPFLWSGLGDVTSQDFIKFWGKFFALVLLVLIENLHGFKTF
jgi:hypothetical protein